MNSVGNMRLIREEATIADKLTSELIIMHQQLQAAQVNARLSASLRGRAAEYVQLIESELHQRSIEEEW